MAGQGVGQLAIGRGAARAQLLQLLQMPSRRAQPAKAPAPRALRRARMAMEQHGAITERSRSDHGATTERPRSGAERHHGAARPSPAEPLRGICTERLRAPPRGAARGAGAEQLHEAACVAAQA